ncbi:acyl-CoA dehydrogenase family protein [Rhodococcus aetherivorans]
MTAAPLVERSLDTDLPEFRRIFDRIAAGAAQRERDRFLPYAEVDELFAAGFGALRVPTEFGGYGVSLTTLSDLLAELGQADSNIPQILRGHFTTVEILRNTVDGDARAHWLGRIGRGAAFGNAQSETKGKAVSDISTIVTDVDGRLVVTGEKYYSTGTLYADYVRVAVVDAAGRRRFVIVDATGPGVERVDDWDGFGQRLTASGTTRFDAAPVAELGEFEARPGFLGQQPTFVQLVHLATLAGIARNLRDDAIDLVRSRTRTSLHAPSERPTEDYSVLGAVGRIATNVLVVDNLVRTVAADLDAANERFAAGGDAEDVYPEVFVRTSAAQIAIIDAVLDSANRIFDAGGSSAVREHHNFDRHWRNARTLASHNPVVYKPTVIGDFLVNGTAPKTFATAYTEK